MAPPHGEAPDDRPRVTEPDLDPPFEARPTLDDRAAAEAVDPSIAREAQPDDDVEYADAPTVVPAEGATKKKHGLFWVLGLVLFAALAGPVLFYFFVWRYKPVALAHVPAGTNLAFRVDARELYLFPPFREHVLGPLAVSDGVEKRADRLKKLTGIDLRTDLREIVFASPDGERFVVLLGGYFNQPRMSQASTIKGLSDFLAQEKREGFTLNGDVLTGPGGIQIAQADDSTIIVASDTEMLGAARSPSDEYKNLGLAGSGAMSFAIDGPAFAHAARALDAIGGAPVVAHTKRASGFFKLGDKPELDAELIPEGVDSETLAREVGESIRVLGLALALAPDDFGEKAALEKAQLRPRNASVLVTAPWPREGIEEAMKRFGERETAFFAEP